LKDFVQCLRGQGVERRAAEKNLGWRSSDVARNATRATRQSISWDRDIAHGAVASCCEVFLFQVEGGMVVLLQKETWPSKQGTKKF